MMALVRGVIRRSSCVSSKFRVSGLISMKIGRAPRSTKALTVETKVKEGTITSSPGLRSRSSAAISSACVQDVVSMALGTPRVYSSKLWHFLVNIPSPDSCPQLIAWRIYSNSLPLKNGRLNGMCKKRFPLNRYASSLSSTRDNYAHADQQETQHLW